MALENILLIITGTLTALLAGFFYAFTVAVNGGLGRLKDREYIRAMQSINIVVVNPSFLLSLMGPVVLLPLVTFLYGGEWGSPRFTLLAAASILHVSSFAITMSKNVPMNNKLATLDTDSASDKEIAAARKLFQMPWNRLNTLRMWTSIAATALVFAAFLVKV
jgi:uncharacterized membrane protein